MVNVPELAKSAVMAFIGEKYDGDMIKRINGFDITENTLFVTWSSKVLKNWKALVGSTIPGTPYYEVTYDGEKNLVYVDEYVKKENAMLTMAMITGNISAPMVSESTEEVVEELSQFQRYIRGELMSKFQRYIRDDKDINRTIAKGIERNMEDHLDSKQLSSPEQMVNAIKNMHEELNKDESSPSKGLLNIMKEGK